MPRCSLIDGDPPWLKIDSIKVFGPSQTLQASSGHPCRISTNGPSQSLSLHRAIRSRFERVTNDRERRGKRRALNRIEIENRDSNKTRYEGNQDRPFSLQNSFQHGIGSRVVAHCWWTLARLFQAMRSRCREFFGIPGNWMGRAAYRRRRVGWAAAAGAPSRWTVRVCRAAGPDSGAPVRSVPWPNELLLDERNQKENHQNRQKIGEQHHCWPLLGRSQIATVDGNVDIENDPGRLGLVRFAKWALELVIFECV